MASVKFLEEALSNDIDESAVSALVGSLENQLVTSTPTNNNQSGALNPQNHINSAISNGGTIASSQKHHGTIANGNSFNITDNNKVILNNTTIVAGSGVPASMPVCVQQSQAQPQQQQNTIVAITNTNYSEPNKLQHGQNDGALKIVYTQGNQQAMTSTGAILTTNRVTFPTVTQTLPNGTIGLSAITAQQPNATILHATSSHSGPGNLQSKQPTIVLKTAAPTGTGAGGLMTVPMNMPHPVNNVGSPTTTNTPHTNTQPNILSTHLQVVNVRPGIPITQPQQKGQPTRVVLSAPQLVGARQGTPQLILQSLQGLQPGQQGQLLLKTENGQFQLLRVGPAPAGVNAGPNQNVTFRMQQVPAQAVTTTAIPVVCQGTVAPIVTAPTITTTPVPKPATDNTKEKCRKFLANLLELSSREPKSVERNVRTLIQELIDMRVEPEDFCDRLERLLNASPQPCLIGFLKKSLPLLRHSLATKEMMIDGIRPPPANVVFSIAGTQTTGAPAGTTTLIQTQQQVVRPTITQQHVRLVAPGTVMRPQQIQIQGQQRLVTPIRTAGGQFQQQVVQRMVRPQQVMVNNQPVIVSTSQPPALHPVIYNTQQSSAQQIVRGVTPLTIGTSPHQQAQGPTQVNIIRGPTLLQHHQLQHQHQQQHLQQQQQIISAGTAPTNIQVLRQNQVVNTSAMGLSGGPAASTPPMSQSGPIPPMGSTAQGSNKMIVRTVKASNAAARMKSAQAAAAAAATSRAAANAASSFAVAPATMLALPGPGSSSVSASIAAVASGAGGPPVSAYAAAAAAKLQFAAAASSAKLATEAKKSFSSSSAAAAYAGDDDINDVAAMGGVNLAEETQRILGSTEFVGTQIRSCKEEFFLSMAPLQMRIRQAMARHSLDEPQTSEVAAVISHAAQERLRNLVEKLAIVTEHRLEVVKGDNRYEIRSDIKGQLKFLEELDRAERKRHEEMERELLLRAAKSRSKTEDPEQAKLKAKAKEMQRVEMEELRQREANATALQAIGPRKKPRLDGVDTITPGTSQAMLSGASSSVSRGQMPLRQRLKKVTMKDLQFMFESEKDLCKSTLLYKSYLK